MSTVAWRLLGPIICFSLALPIAPLFGQVSVKLLPSEGADFDYFGEAVSIDGDYAVVGSWLDDNTNGKDAGTARIFHRVGAQWEEQAIFLASDGEAGDQFGISVSINGDFAFVGAHRDDNANGAFAGAVYVFERAGENWTEKTKITANDGVFNDLFGGSIASSGNRLIIGAPGTNQQQGAVYIYHQSGGDWLFVNRVNSSDGAVGDAFGKSVGIDGDYAIAGAETHDGNGIADAGAAYILSFNGSEWVEQTKLVSESAILEGAFGWSVGISGNDAIVGAPNESVNGLDEAGTAYVFTKDGNAWNQQAKLQANEEEGGDAFGYAVAIDDGYAVVGARWDRNSNGDKSGAAYVFTRIGVTWLSEARLLASDGEIGDQLGNAVDISNDQVLVGARWDDNEVGKDAGAAYVFPIGGAGVPDLFTSETTIDFGSIAVGENTDRSFLVQNIGTSDLNVLSVQIEGVDASSFRFVQGGNSVIMAPLAAVDVIVEFAPNSPGVKNVSIRIESNSPSSPHIVDLEGEGTDGFQPAIAKVIAFRGEVASLFGSTVSVNGDYAIVGAEGQNQTEPGAAYIFKRAGTTWVQQARIEALDGEVGDRFGSSVDISSTHVIVGAWNDDEARGAAYIFVKSGTAWIQQARLTAVDREVEDRFGRSVSIEGDYAIVGAWQDDNIRGVGAGAAYVYELNGSTWQQQFKMIATDGRQGDRFGSAVAIQGDAAIVGAANGGFFGEGTAYAFARDGATWQEEGKLAASDAGLSDGFGSTVAIEGNFAVVGAPIHDRQASIDEGAAYVFENLGGTWIERSKLVASDGASGYGFGASVDIVGDEIVVGAGGANNQAGAIYIFTRSGNVWSETNIVSPIDGESGDAFGSALGFTGSDIIVGAPEDNNINGLRAGSVQLFSRNETTWDRRALLLAASRVVRPRFGTSVALDGDYAVVGAEGDANTPGAAYVYRRTGESWTQQSELIASNNEAGNHFGTSVDVSGDYIVIGASQDDNEKGTNAGTVYVFLRSSDSWSEQSRLVAVDGQDNDAFGSSVTIDGDFIGIGAPGEDNLSGDDAGSVYVFNRVGAAWTQHAKLTSSDGNSGDAFGSSVALQEETLVAGSPNEGLLQSGALYVFERVGASWNEFAKLISSDAQAGESLGNVVAIDDDYILAGAKERSSAAGAVYVYNRSGGRWGETEVSLLERDGGSGGDRFGAAVSLSGDFALIGGSGIDSGRGASFLYQLNNDTWLQQTQLNPTDDGGNDAFGQAVALQGEHAVVGARNDQNGNGIDAGAAYLMSLTGSVFIVGFENEREANHAFELFQNYPNPFTRRTTIPFKISQQSSVKLEVFDILGRRVNSLIDAEIPAGNYEVIFDEPYLSNGVYFYRLSTNNRIQTMRMILLE